MDELEEHAVKHAVAFESLERGVEASGHHGHYHRVHESGQDGQSHVGGKVIFAESQLADRLAKVREGAFTVLLVDPARQEVSERLSPDGLSDSVVVERIVAQEIQRGGELRESLVSSVYGDGDTDDVFQEGSTRVEADQSVESDSVFLLEQEFPVLDVEVAKIPHVDALVPLCEEGVPQPLISGKTAKFLANGGN